MEEQIHKIVRNKIPDKIKNKGENCKYYIANNAEKYKFLVLKIIEELNEIDTAKDKTSTYKEIGDLQQVISDLSNHIINTDFGDYDDQENFMDIETTKSLSTQEFYESYTNTWKKFGVATNQKDVLGVVNELTNKLNGFILDNQFNVNEIDTYRNQKLEKLGGFDEGIIITHY